MGEGCKYTFFEIILRWAAERATCNNKDCPVTNRRECCTLQDMADSCRFSVFDIVNPDFLRDKGVQNNIRTNHCLTTVRARVDGWEEAKLVEDSDGRIGINKN